MLLMMDARKGQGVTGLYWSPGFLSPVLRGYRSLSLIHATLVREHCQQPTRGHDSRGRERPMSMRRPPWGERSERTDGGSPSEPTLLGARWTSENSREYHARAGEAPTWPPPGTASGEHGAGSGSPSSMRVTVLAFAMGGMALLVGLFSLLSHTGLISLGAGATC